MNLLRRIWARLTRRKPQPLRLNWDNRQSPVWVNDQPVAGVESYTWHSDGRVELTINLGTNPAQWLGYKVGSAKLDRINKGPSL